MREELYLKLCEQLLQVEGIRHVDLWNHNVEFIEQEEGWERPAVFVEFKPIEWNATVPGVRYTASPEIHLHIVTDWQGSSAANSATQNDSMAAFGLSRAIHENLCGLSGETFRGLDLVKNLTNHNHDDIIESIDVYNCAAYKKLGQGM